MPPRRKTVSPGDRLALAVVSEQAVGPPSGVSLAQAAHAAVPDGLTQYVPAKLLTGTARHAQKESERRMCTKSAEIDVVLEAHNTGKPPGPESPLAEQFGLPTAGLTIADS